jgi:hypothetical protein
MAPRDRPGRDPAVGDGAASQGAAGQGAAGQGAAGNGAADNGAVGNGAVGNGAARGGATGNGAGGAGAGGSGTGGTGAGSHRAVGHRKRAVRLNVLLTIGLLGVFSNALPQLATGWPANTVQWVLLATGALCEAVLVALSLGRLLIVAEGVTGVTGVTGKISPPVRLRVVLISAGVVIGLVVGVAFAATSVWQRLDVVINGCPEPTEVRVLTTPESAGPTRQLADAYELQTANRNRGCRTVSVYVFSAPADVARDALASGWSTDALRDVGPRPDVWLSDSSLQVSDLRALTSHNGLPVPVAETRTVAWSPIVVGIPVGAVEGGVRSARTSVPWGELLAGVGALPGGLVRADPGSSLTGQIATTALYADVAAAGPTPRELESRIANALDRGAYPLSDDLSLLCRQHGADAPVAAVITTEQTLMRFNRGDPLGPDCPVGQGAVPPRQALTAFYPTGTPALDHQFVRLSWANGTGNGGGNGNGGGGGQPSSSGEQAAAASDFGQWLGTDDGSRALLSIGLRPPVGYQITEPLTNQFGVLPGAVFDRRPPDAGAVSAAMLRYATARRTGRVLLALDTSGSMGAAAGIGGSRLTVAAEGIRGALGLMGPADEFGLWTFPGSASSAGPRMLVPLGYRDAPVAGQSRQQATARYLAALRPAGDTPLYATIVAGVQAVGPAADNRIRALVVLTDGEDTASHLNVAQTVAAVRGRGVRVFVVAVGEADCAGGVATITSVTGGACYQADFDTVDARLSQLFGVLWEGGG